MVVSDSVDVFAASDLKHSTIFFRTARETVTREAAQAKLARVGNINEGERTPQEASNVAKGHLKKETEKSQYAAKVEAKRKEAEEKGLEPPRTLKKYLSWDERLAQVTAHKRNHRHLPKQSESILGTELYVWAYGQVQSLKNKPKQERIKRLRGISYSFET